MANGKLDWSKATDSQLAEAIAERQRRQPLTDFEDVDWGNLSPSDFETKRAAVFRAVRHGADEKRIRAEAAELEAEALRREP